MENAGKLQASPSRGNTLFVELICKSGDLLPMRHSGETTPGEGYNFLEHILLIMEMYVSKFFCILPFVKMYG